MEAILDRRVQSLSNLHWYDSEHLIGQFTNPATDESAIYLIPLTGELGTPLQKGTYPSVSPDGRLLILHTAKGWLVRDTSSGKEVRFEPTYDELRLSPYSRPAWSEDSRYAAVMERYSLKDLRSKAITKTNVPVINVAEQLSTRKQAASQIIIFDRKNPNHQQRIVLNEIALEMRWGSKRSLFISKSKLLSGDASTAVVRIEPGSGEVNEIYRTSGRFQEMVPAVQPGGQLIALVLDVDNRTWDDFQSLLFVDPKTGSEVRRVTQDLPLLGQDYTWSLKGDEIYARVRNGGLDQIYAIPRQGRPRQLTRGPRRHFSISLSPDGQRLAYQTEDGYGRRDIRILHLTSGKEEVAFVLDEPAKDFALGAWRHIRWESTDGVHPFGFLFFPADFDATKSYPMLVDVHGGGEGSRLYLNAPLTKSVAPGPLEWHAWAALGYVVFVPDYRSTGDYGPEVISARYQAGVSAAVKDIEDVISGTRFVIREEPIDPTRVAILGHSAGGRRVYLLLTKYDLYAAAILNEATAPDPVSLIIGLVSGVNTGNYPEGLFRQMYGGKLAEFPDRYKANYMFDSYRIRTPTLIMVGNEAIGGVMHMPNEVLYSILRHHHIPAKMLRFTKEGHTYSSPASALHAFEQARSWLMVHLGLP